MGRQKYNRGSFSESGLAGTVNLFAEVKDHVRTPDTTTRDR